MASYAWKTHQGKEYLYINHGGTEEETIQNIARVKEEVLASGKKNLIILGDTTGSFGTQSVMNAIMDLGKALTPLTTRWAVLGVTGIKKILLKTFNAFTGGIAIPFDTEAQAMDYLFK